MSEALIDNLVAFGSVGVIAVAVLAWYVWMKRRISKINLSKIQAAKKVGTHEPLSLHPVVSDEICIGSGACITACPEKDILGIIDGKAHVINAARCVGHGACFHACPVHAISLNIGTEKRGVDLPHVSQEFETNIPGLYIAGELGGMALIKNAVEQGKQAVQFFARKMDKTSTTDFDLVVVGAGPAGISATLAAVKCGLQCLTLEQDTLGGTVFNFPRQKIVMTAPMDLPLYGKVKFRESRKTDLIDIWRQALRQNEVIINENEKVEAISKDRGIFKVTSSKGTYTSKGIVMAIGRRGSPRKLGVPGEEKEKVAYRLLDPELIQDKKVLIVGGGDSAIENAMMVADADIRNVVTIAYRGDNFSRLKPGNIENISIAIANKRIVAMFNTNVQEIFDDKVALTLKDQPEPAVIENDLVYIFAGGTLPTEFLQKVGVSFQTMFGDAILKHEA